MADDKPTIDELSAQWRTTLGSFKESLNLYSVPVPDFCVYELTHAIMHIAVGYNNPQPTDADIAACMKPSCDHACRVHLDYLKHLLRYTDAYLLKYFRQSPEHLDFHRAQASARLLEVKKIGTNHKETIECFRTIIRIHWENVKKHVPGLLTDQESFKYLPDVGKAALETKKLLELECRDMLRQWARLETINSSLFGVKSYNVSHELLNSYIKYETFEHDLAALVVSLKMGIIRRALHIDPGDTLKQSLDETAYRVISPVMDKIQNSDPVKAASELKVIGQHIDEPFSVVTEFLKIPRSLLE